ncbi:hypothetical protein L195_g050941, partial [Trifolium pratense]
MTSMLNQILRWIKQPKVNGKPDLYNMVSGSAFAFMSLDQRVQQDQDSASITQIPDSSSVELTNTSAIPVDSHRVNSDSVALSENNDLGHQQQNEGISEPRAEGENEGIIRRIGIVRQPRVE